MTESLEINIKTVNKSCLTFVNSPEIPIEEVPIH